VFLKEVRMVKNSQTFLLGKFSLKKRWLSVYIATRGFRSFLTTEHNAIIHLLATLTVIVLIILLPVSRLEIILLVIVTGLVWAAELFNTAIEKLIDFISIEKDSKIKFIKDVAAAAVLVAAVVAFIIGCLIFIPKF
ncbi:MAG: diacylglycerol kinase, partial [Chitinophagaceae bacterium]